MRRREMSGDGGNHHEKLGLERFLRVPVNLPSPIQQVRVPTRCVISLIRGLPNPIRQVIPRISHIRLYPPHRLSSSSPSLSFSSTTLPSLQNTRVSHLYLCLYVMIMSLHQVQHTPSTTIHRVQPFTVCKYTPSTVYTKYSIHPRLFVFPPFSSLRVGP